MPGRLPRNDESKMTKIAVVTDLQANREAVEAVFAHARAQGATE